VDQIDDEAKRDEAYDSEVYLMCFWELGAP